MARSRRPIDPPELPAWTRSHQAGDEDETPTLTGLDGADPFDSEETQWEAVPPSDSVAARWAAVSPSGFHDDSDSGTPAPGGRVDETLSDPGSAPVLTPQPLGEAKEDPRALAQRLAAEAKARASSGPAPEPNEDPRELARRLAAEARAKLAASNETVPLGHDAPTDPASPTPIHEVASTSATPVEDPRELAKRLAAEAKARIAATPAPAPPASTPPAPPVEDPRDLAKRLAAEAKARIAATPAPAPPAAAPTPPRSTPPPAPRHLEHKRSKPRSAKEILEEALRQEAKKEAAPAPTRPSPAPPAPVVEASAPAPAASTPAPATAATPAQAANAALARKATPAPAASRPPQASQASRASQGSPASQAPGAPSAPEASPAGTDGASILLKLLPGAAVEAPVAIQRPEVFQAVWRAHRTRALHEQDWGALASAGVLIDAADRLQQGSLRPGAFVGCRVGLGGVPHAVFADLDRPCILAILSPADVYLAGLSDSP